ncbi:putative methylesterase 11, chloroplastic [Cocos nucifera]|uniref:Putative methylesterase 11, chloroplastic n=1 Tax=Cocos nucifera TaxID=13894 RepID=A0A8K0N1N7_COCNU|nr:putative methylesterase 11, chloroplastic [Cocos nucifera]
MGALVSCFSAAEETKWPRAPRRRSAVNPPPAAAGGIGSSERWSKGRAGRKERVEEALIHEQALAAAAALLAQQNGRALPFDRSSSLRYPSQGQKKPALPRSSSSRARSLTDPVVQPQQLVHEAGTNDLMQQAQTFVYANGNDHPPTAIDLDKSSLKELLFNQSPAKVCGNLFLCEAVSSTGNILFRVTLIRGILPLTSFNTLHAFLKDVALALVSMRPIPFAPVLEKLSLTDENYGSVRRFYIETHEDNAIPLSLQQSMCGINPPERVFRLKSSDHSPFFSKPQALNKLLVEISKIASPQVQ